MAGAIPVVDYGPLFAGVPESVIERAFAAARRCHALPLDDKLKLRLNENNIGYLPLDASVQGASRVHQATRPNRNESFFVSHDRGPEHPEMRAGKGHASAAQRMAEAASA